MPLWPLETDALKTLKPAYKIGKQGWFLVLQAIAFAVLMGLTIRLALHEPFEDGAIAIFLLLALPFAAVLSGSRRTLSIAFAIGGALVLLEAADEEKVHLLGEHLHFIDFLSLWEYKTVLIELYADLGIRIALLICAFAIGFFILRLVEKRGFSLRYSFSGSPTAFLILGVASISNAVLFLNGNYFWATTNIFVYSRMENRGPFTTSALLSSVIDYLHVQNELRGGSDQLGPSAKADTLPQKAAVWSSQPDVITVHVESVFDPVILKSYADTSSLTSFFSQRLVSSNGPLRTHVMGGWSIISEFSFSCGLDHRVFGISGLFPNLFLPRAIKRCIPGYLRDNGYSTEMISSAYANYVYYGETYKAYGVDDYNGPEIFKVPVKWGSARDSLFVDAAIERLEQPRVRPRLLMIVEAFNHGPHGPTIYTDRGQIFPGPYDLSRADNEELKDYMNRLNDTVTAFRRLEEFIADRGVPTVIIYYGDHQPDIKMDFSVEALNRFGQDIKHVTFYRMARNFPSPKPPENDRYLGIDQLFGEGLTFGGVPPSPELQLKEKYSHNCPRDPSACDEQERRAIRSAILK